MYLNQLTRLLFKDYNKKIVEFDNLIIKLANRRIPLIYPGDKHEMPKIEWKYRTYNEIALHKTVDLTMSFCDSWNNGFVGTCFILVRSIYENVAYVFDIMKKLDMYVNEKDIDKIDDLIMNRLFGVRKSLTGKLPLIVNVMTAIESTDKIVKGFKEHYEILCEFAHPNHWAMYELYCLDHPESHSSEISSARGVNEKNFTFLIDSIMPVLMNIDITLDNINELYPKLSILCNVDKKGT